ncbi:ABC transporter family substrate-binding protein [Streptomyces sp. TRM76323]|uniref:ABC transporter family substrate-binding protein n=1 Tax=Streptomyces tamarix TaxID=3078565 RepID=A0ABU3QT25_9ACTN|nr:ABC transporter family substrate-binding protein [Streptomyces tamarix]MDT9685678.1 ABC transporter family substrate-binding protein [Streptomyces tamarix]
MSQVGVRALRSAALLTSGALAVSVLAGCSSGDEENTGRAVPADIAAAPRSEVADGGTLRWAVDALPATLNTFQADADAATARVAGAVLPALFTLDERGRPQPNPDYLESAEIIEREPKQVVRYKLHQQAVWSDGREIGASDFVAQWRALRGRDSAYWTARNAGYERIEKIERGADDLEVRVTFGKPYADWKSLFTPLYPKEVTGSPSTFNDGARTRLPRTAGPFRLKAVDTKAGTLTLVRDPRWWGEPAKLDSLVLRAVPRGRRAEALLANAVDIAEVDAAVAARVTRAGGEGRPGAGGRPAADGPDTAKAPSAALESWAAAYGSDEAKAAAARAARLRDQRAAAAYETERRALSGYVVRKTLEPAFTQLALNGESGPLADERVRRAVARALDRRELAETVLAPLGLPAEPVGSHLALAGQDAYADSSGALGGQDTEEALALLADAGWTKAGARASAAPTKGAKAGAEASGTPSKGASPAAAPERPPGAATGAKTVDLPSDDGLYIVGDEKPSDGGGPGTHVLAPAPAAAVHSRLVLGQARAVTAALADEETGTDETGTDDETGSGDAEEAGEPRDASGTERPKAKGGAPGAYAPVGTAAPAAPAAPSGKPGAAGPAGPLGKDGRPLALRFVLPSGPGSESLRTVGEKIAAMLDRVGVRTEISKVPDESFFKDHIASGDYDLALYSWPGTAFPATDGRPIYAKPEPATDGSLLVEQNYTRVGTDHIDQLFEQAAAELDEKAARDLVRRADARIWAAAGSIPLFQRPELVAVRKNVVNAGAFGFTTPRYENIGFAAPKKK